MRFSLRRRVLILITLVNIAVFTAVGAKLVDTFREQTQSSFVQLNQQLLRTVRSGLRAGPGAENVASLLEFPGWVNVEDAILVQNNFARGVVGPSPQGLVLNPAGRAGRSASMDEQAVFTALATAAREGIAIPVEDGFALPLRVDGLIWGASWMKMPAVRPLRELVRYLLPWFLGSTAALVLASALLLGGVVLAPLERLTMVARRMSDGDLSARAPETGRGDEISELVRTFNGMAERVEGFSRTLEQRVEAALAQARDAEQAAMIQRQLAAMGELAAGIAHEINNPLGGLINAAGALKNDGLPAERRERYLDLLTDGLERIRTTVGQVLRMAPRETEPEQVDLAETVRDSIALVAHRAGNVGVEVVHETAGLEPGSATVLGALNELGQVVLNLLVNAIDAVEDGVGVDFGRARPRVVVRLVPAADGVLIEVRDNGPGADPDLLLRLRDPFFSTKEVGRGTGLGLSIVARVVDLHGGRLDLESAPGAGFIARARLPRQGNWSGGTGPSAGALEPNEEGAD